MVMDWNPIVSAGVGGVVGVLGSVLTQRVQVHRDRVRTIEERATNSAIRAIGLLSEFHSDIARLAFEATYNNELYDWPDPYLESDGFQTARAKLHVEALLIPKKSTRQAVALVADRLQMSWSIGDHTGFDGDTVALELCEYAREVLGRFLRGEKNRRVPARIQTYWKAFESLEKEWEKSRDAREEERRLKFAQQRESLARRQRAEAASSASPPSPEDDSEGNESTD